MNWDSRLPDGLSYRGNVPGGFKLGVEMATDEQGLSPCRCPDEPSHRFKVAVTSTEQVVDSTMWCPYCGKQAPTRNFMPEQMARARAAVAREATRRLERDLDKIMRDMAAKFSRRAGRSGGITIQYTHARRRLTRALPTYEIEPTRRAMTCSRCNETCAVYGLATYCPACGRHAPAQQLTTLIAVHRDRVTELDNVDTTTKQRLTDSGIITATYESSFKDGFGALETYLKNRFLEEAPPLPKPPTSTTFQRLDDTNDLYKAHLGVDLEALAGPDNWTALHRAAAIRHVLTHSAGEIDAKFLQRLPQWHQAEGQRLIIGRAEMLAFLDALTRFADAVLS
jgi:hypothetical protein